MEQCAPVRVAQLDVVVAGLKGKFLRLLDPIRKTAIYVERRIHEVSLDFDIPEVLGHVIDRIRIPVRIRVGEEWIVEKRIEDPNGFNNHNPLTWRWLWSRHRRPLHRRGQSL